MYVCMGQKKKKVPKEGSIIDDRLPVAFTPFLFLYMNEVR